MQIAFLFYEGMTALDAVGPHEILCRLPKELAMLVVEEFLRSHRVFFEKISCDHN